MAEMLETYEKSTDLVDLQEEQILKDSPSKDKAGIGIEYIQGESSDHSKSDTQGKRKYSNSYQEILLLKTSLNSTLLKKLLMFLLPKQIYMQGSILKGKGIT